MKVLGIDYGTKRIGIAISDETQTLARELEILSPKEFFQKIDTIIKDNVIEQIVVGLPLNMEGQDTEKTREVKEFSEKLRDISGMPVELVDERLSSSMTENLPGGNKDKDSLAAQIILQNYLDKRKTQDTF